MDTLRADVIRRMSQPPDDFPAKQRQEVEDLLADKVRVTTRIDCLGKEKYYYDVQLPMVIHPGWLEQKKDHA